MELDWLTVGAQALNFVVLVLLLRHLLYGRIVDAVERRREEITSRRDEAEARLEEADERLREAEEEQARLEEEREERRDRIRAEVEEERTRRREELREEVEELRRHWRRGVEREREDFLRELRERAGSATRAALRRALRDLADAELQEQTLRVFLDRLEEAAGDEELRAAVSRAGHVTVRTATETGGEREDRIRDALHERFGSEVEVGFRDSPGMVLGLRLEAGDREVAWTAEDWLDALDAEVGELLRETIEERAPEEAGREDADRNGPAGDDGNDGDDGDDASREEDA